MPLPQSFAVQRPLRVVLTTPNQICPSNPLPPCEMFTCPPKKMGPTSCIHPTTPLTTHSPAAISRRPSPAQVTSPHSEGSQRGCEGNGSAPAVHLTRPNRERVDTASRRVVGVGGGAASPQEGSEIRRLVYPLWLGSLPITQTLLETGIFTDQLGGSGLIGSPMAVPWRVWVIYQIHLPIH